MTETYEVWRTNVFGASIKFEKGEDNYSQLCRASPVFGILDPDLSFNELLPAAENLLKTIFPGTQVPPPTEFTDFTRFIHEHLDVLQPTTAPQVQNLAASLDLMKKRFSTVWSFIDLLKDPKIFVKAMPRMRNEIPPELCEQLLDHYVPMLESVNVSQESLEIRHLLARSLVWISSAASFHGEGWNKHCISLFRALTRISAKCNGWFAAESFRTATTLYRRDFDVMTPKQQADELLRFVQRFPSRHTFRSAAIRFAIQMHPEQFGFVSLAKSVIAGGVIDQNEIHHIIKILNLRYVKNPTDIYKWLLNAAASHKYLAKTALHAVVTTISRYLAVDDVKTLIDTHIKRLCVLVCLCEKSGSAKRRKNLALASLRAFYDTSSLRYYVMRYTAAAIKFGDVQNRFGFNVDCDLCVDQDKDAFEVSPDRIDIKQYIENGEEALITTQRSSAPRSGRSGKSTIAEVKARYRQAMSNGNYTPPNDLSLLKDN